MSPHITPSSVSDKKLLAAGRQRCDEDDIQDERGTQVGVDTSINRDDAGDDCDLTGDVIVQNECEARVNPLVKLEEKSSVMMSNDEAGRNEIKGDAMCLLDKNGTRCTTHDCPARMVTTYHIRDGSSDRKGRTMGMCQPR